MSESNNIEQFEQNRIAISIGFFAVLFVLNPLVEDSTSEIKLLFYLTTFVTMFYGLYLFFIALSYTPQRVGKHQSLYFEKFRETAYLNYLLGSVVAFLFMIVIVISYIFQGLAEEILGIKVPVIFQQLLLIFIIAIEAKKMLDIKSKKIQNTAWASHRS